MDSIKQYWHTWLWRDAVTKLITINFIVWLAVAACIMVNFALYSYLAIPGSISQLPARIWTIFTYMFTHADFMHMFVNMMWLLLFGQLFINTQGGFRLGTLYIYGGLVGAAAFVLYNALIGGTHLAMYGASCSVLAVIGAVTVMMHRWNVNLFIIGEIRLLWLSVAALLLFALSSVSIDQAVAHCAGLLIGVAYGLLKLKGIDITRPVSWLNSQVSARRPLTARPASNVQVDKSEEQVLDALLDKISRMGYGSLSPTERQLLFNLSQKIKRN